MNAVATETRKGQCQWEYRDGVWLGHRAAEKVQYELRAMTLTIEGGFSSFYNSPEFILEIYEAIIAQQLEKLDANTPSPSHLDGPDG
jgi:hypothetical protein